MVLRRFEPILERMKRLRSALAAIVLATVVAGLPATSATAADTVAACDPATAPGLTWGTPAFLAWGRSERVGADVAGAAAGATYSDGSAALSVDSGSVAVAPDPVAHDLEFALSAPTSGSSLHASASWSEVDAGGSALCTQTATLTVPTGRGETLRFTPKALPDGGIAWIGKGAGDCHDIALLAISLTVQQGRVARHLSAPDECAPLGTRHAGTANWRIAVTGGHFELHALPVHSSLTAKLRYALRVGSRRVAAGSISLTRSYQPTQQILETNPAFGNVCVHSAYPMHRIGSLIGCDVPGVMSATLKLS
jgi:hypothetical protein